MSAAAQISSAAAEVFRNLLARHLTSSAYDVLVYGLVTELHDAIESALLEHAADAYEQGLHDGEVSRGHVIKQGRMKWIAPGDRHEEHERHD
jgi:hypothetical protein